MNIPAAAAFGIPMRMEPAYSFVTVNHKKGLYIYLVVYYLYFFQLKNIVKSHFLHLHEHHQMLWSTFLWNCYKTIG